MLFLRIYNTEFTNIPVLSLKNNSQTCFKPPDYLLGVVSSSYAADTIQG